MRNGDCENNRRNAAVAQSVERRLGKAEVTGPIPVSSFSVRRYLLRCVLSAAVAQSVERRLGKAEVTGPIPVSSLRVKKTCILGIFL